MSFTFKKEHSDIIKKLFSDYSTVVMEGLKIMNQETQSKDDVIKILNFLSSRPAKESNQALNAFNASIVPQIKKDEDGDKNKESKSSSKDS